MACNIKKAPKPVRPLRPGESTSFKEADISMFDLQTTEHINKVGTDIEYFSLDLDNSPRDPVYDEPISHEYSPPYNLKAYITYPEANFSVRDDGVQAIFMCQATLARKHVEDLNMPVPKPTDLIRFWNIPFFNRQAVINGRSYDGASFMFDVLNVTDDGHIFDSPSFTTFKLTLKRRTEFPAERKLFNY